MTRGSDKLPASETPRRPRVLIGGVGLPWRKDLDLGRLLIEDLASGDWPAGVLAEDFSYSAHRVMHTLQELRPEKLILVGATSRGNTPGTVRRYHPADAAVDDDDVIARLGESVGGVIDLDHIVVVNQYFGTFPADTVIIEVEAGDQEFGLGYSDSVNEALPEVIALIHREIAS